jgi:hypothetical protein
VEGAKETSFITGWGVDGGGEGGQKYLQYRMTYTYIYHTQNFWRRDQQKRKNKYTVLFVCVDYNNHLHSVEKPVEIQNLQPAS